MHCTNQFRNLYKLLCVVRCTWKVIKVRWRIPSSLYKLIGFSVANSIGFSITFAAVACALRRSLGARFRMSSKCAVYHRFLHNIVYHLGPRFRMSSSCVACHRFLNKTSRKSLYRSSRSIMALCTNSIAEEAVRQAAAASTFEAR